MMGAPNVKAAALMGACGLGTEELTRANLTPQSGGDATLYEKIGKVRTEIGVLRQATQTPENDAILRSALQILFRRELHRRAQNLRQLEKELAA